MATVRKDDRLTSSQSLLCVGFAGIFSKTVTSPLEVVKILSQIGTFHCKRGFVHSFVVINQNEGLRAFWKGNMVSCLRLFPYSAIHLATYKRWVLNILLNTAQNWIHHCQVLYPYRLYTVPVFYFVLELMTFQSAVMVNKHWQEVDVLA